MKAHARRNFIAHKIKLCAQEKIKIQTDADPRLQLDPALYQGTPANKVIVELNPDRLQTKLLDVGARSKELQQMMFWVLKNPGNQSCYAMLGMLFVDRLPVVQCIDHLVLRFQSNICGHEGPCLALQACWWYTL